MKTLVKKVALDLIQKNQMTTTLEVKEQLIATEPTYFWKQSFISEALAELADNGELTFRDNGTFRVYADSSGLAVAVAGKFKGLGVSVLQPTTPTNKYTKVPLSKRNVVKVSLTALAKVVEDNAGKFAGIVHTKITNGQQNTMNCQILKGLTPLGAIQVKEQGQLKTIYPTSLLEVRLGGTVYQLK